MRERKRKGRLSTWELRRDEEGREGESEDENAKLRKDRENGRAWERGTRKGISK